MIPRGHKCPPYVGFATISQKIATKAKNAGTPSITHARKYFQYAGVRRQDVQPLHDQGAVSSLLSTAALAVLGKREANSHFAPTNAISHWIWGEKAARRNTPSVRYTLPGYAIHHASATFWSVLFERTCGHLLDARDTGKTLAAATATSAVACFVDYQLTPERLKPGYEKRLSRPALAVVFGAFALGLAGGAMLCRRSLSLR